MRWGMVIDLKRCVGCYSCMISCKQENFLPPSYFWNRVLIGESGKYPNVRKLMYPVLCNHCKEAPCVDVCPTKPRVFGDLNDKNSDISQFVRNNPVQVLKPESGNGPMCFYVGIDKDVS